MNRTDNRIVNMIFWAVAAAVVAIGAGSFALSFNALHDLAQQNGQPARLAWIWPAIVDISLVIYTAAVLVAQLQRRPARLPIALTVGYGLVTVAGNLLHAPGTPAGYFVAALPPLSLILGTELLRVMAKHQIEYRAALASLAELAAQQQQAQAELDQLRQQAAADLDKLTGQIEAKQAQLDRLKGDISEAKTGKNARSVEEMNAARQDKIEARRQEVLDLLAQGKDKSEIAESLDVSVKTIHRDIKALNGKVNGTP